MAVSILKGGSLPLHRLWLVAAFSIPSPLLLITTDSAVTACHVPHQAPGRKRLTGLLASVPTGPGNWWQRTQTWIPHLLASISASTSPSLGKPGKVSSIHPS